jgi:hypothetical protein
VNYIQGSDISIGLENTGTSHIIPNGNKKGSSDMTTLGHTPRGNIAPILEDQYGIINKR